MTHVRSPDEHRPCEDEEDVTDTAHIRGVAVLGNHLPRRCGIATFTTHLTDGVAATLRCRLLRPGDERHGTAPPLPFETSGTARLI
jgi:hypothetical protein